jgi:hypothetical protein
MEFRTPHHLQEEVLGQLPKEERDPFMTFAMFYFGELITMGTFLKDVKFTELSYLARRKVFQTALKLWTKSRQGL